MKPFIFSIVLFATAWSCRAAEPTSVAQAILMERLRTDPPDTKADVLITAAAIRFVDYFALAKTKAERKQLYAAFQTYSNRILNRARQKLERARDRARPRPRGPVRRA